MQRLDPAKDSDLAPMLQSLGCSTCKLYRMVDSKFELLLSIGGFVWRKEHIENDMDAYLPRRHGRPRDVRKVVSLDPWT